MSILRTLFLTALFGATSCFSAIGTKLASFDFGVTDLIRDDHRDRIYATVPSENSVAVIDSQSLSVVATIFTGSNPVGMSLSPEGSELFVSNSGSNITGIAVLDLETLEISRHISTTGHSMDVAAGNGLVYSREDKIRVYDSESGLPLGQMSTAISSRGTLEISPDRKILYHYTQGTSPSSWHRIDVSAWPGTVVQSGSWGGNGKQMALSADGAWITFVSGSPYHVRILSASDPTSSFGQMDTGAYPTSATFGPHGDRLFLTHNQKHIDVWDTKTFLKTAEIPTTKEKQLLVTDRTGTVLFAGNDSQLSAFHIGPRVEAELPILEINRAVALQWESQLGAIYQIEWSSALGDNATWHPLGLPVLGNGEVMNFFEPTGISKSKFYRLSILSR